ncbi:MAG: Zn-dependent hydrolase [Acidobacteria bacterium]|nr:Zn-dependent hydrolase [Acidobacteriota bacterium]
MVRLSRRAWLSAVGAVTVSAAARPLARARRVPAIDAVRLRRRLEHLSTFGRPPQGTFESGVSRVAYSDADLAARAWLMDEMRGAGLRPRIDPAGNIFARWGPESDRPAILFGSHIDSVPGGGNFDGDLGVLAALEVIQACRSAGVRPRRPLEMVVWAHEESTAFGRGTAASRIVAGDLKAGDLDQVWNGLRRGDGIRRIGGDPSRIDEAVRQDGAWHGYLELHIEQGGTLDRARVPIGIVEGIVAIHRHDVEVAGFANHAGTTPMDERQDALQAASRLVLAVRELVTARQGRQVGTVGRLDVEPNSPNVVPGRVRLSVEFRDLSESTLAAMNGELRARADAIARDTGTTITTTLATTNPPALADAGVQAAIGRAADAAGLEARRLPSGAGHDAQMIARLCPMGMIFVPSIGGVSHSPKERTSWDDCARGAAVLLGAVLDVDARA